MWYRKNYECNQCGKALSSSSSLQICGKNYIESYAINVSHIIIALTVIVIFRNVKQPIMRGNTMNIKKGLRSDYFSFFFFNMERFMDLCVILVQGSCWSSLYRSNFGICAAEASTSICFLIQQSCLSKVLQFISYFQGIARNTIGKEQILVVEKNLSLDF